MWMELRTERRRSEALLLLLQRVALFCCICLCFLSVSALLARSTDIIQSLRTDSHPQSWSKEVGLGRRRLGGPGSYPPRCAGKCGRCAPCLAVHVTVPPGTPTPAEYYPEAWRCKCGNRYYMPWLNGST
ncbi:hypothetical protein J5N97_014698 [Dioscorea zingiberensis]|uniref:Epidermal patterning factor-like protein n=1 Tax=Dioscorea zingiberensis TaxID=325984 RepID=A0A9D5CUC6_9LILI|nr:hypothetical protein J5N97_014698 [Dioscorea zingiberensis]